jgi:hypothetical protein
VSGLNFNTERTNNMRIMKRFGLILVTIAAMISVFTFSQGKVEAANSGWETHGGITAKVYTDRSGSYPTRDSYIGVTGQKTSAGGRVYYSMYLDKYKNGKWYQKDEQMGYLSSQTPMKKFYINNYLSKGQSGTYRIRFKLFSDSGRWDWIGDWYTPSFKVYN